jgi:transcriptional regulator with XRE-family HTH domain
MNPRDILTSVEKRAVARGISMRELCRIAGVDYSAYLQWSKGKETKPFKILHLQSVLDKLP